NRAIKILSAADAPLRQNEQSALPLELAALEAALPELAASARPAETEADRAPVASSPQHPPTMPVRTDPTVSGEDVPRSARSSDAPVAPQRSNLPPRSSAALPAPADLP